MISNGKMRLFNPQVLVTPDKAKQVTPTIDDIIAITSSIIFGRYFPGIGLINIQWFTTFKMYINYQF